MTHGLIGFVASDLWWDLENDAKIHGLLPQIFGLGLKMTPKPASSTASSPLTQTPAQKLPKKPPVPTSEAEDLHLNVL